MLPILLALVASAGQPQSADASQATSNGQPDPASQISRVAPPSGEDISERPGPDGPLYSAGDVATDTKLPVGYPRPTPPGAIEIKVYPSIRQAEFSGDGDGTGASRGGFMPLFNHISSNGIAMTAPVEMRYSDTDDDGTTDGWTMAFLYHTTEDGPTGDDGPVEVIDTEPLTVISIGIQGGRDFTEINAASAKLEAWLDESDDWASAGDMRSLGYNGPYTPIANRWWEVQIPVRRVETDGG
ncbi:MAG: heme-binding protein [Planctomycetota bacterium]